MLRTMILCLLLLLPSGASAEKMKIVVDGYRAGELAFSDVFSRISDQNKVAQINSMIDLLVSAEANPSAGKYGRRGHWALRSSRQRNTISNR